MAFSNAGLNAMLDHLGTLAVKVSMHSATPGTTGANEVAGVTRGDATWAAAAAGSKSLSGTITFSIPAGSTVADYGLWSSDGLTFYGGGALSASETFNGAGTYTLNTATLALA